MNKHSSSTPPRIEMDAEITTRAQMLRLLLQALMAVTLLLYVAALYPFTPSIGDIRKSKQESPSVVLSADGKELAVFRRANRDWVKLQEISPKAVEALLAGLSVPPVLVGSSLGGLVAAAVAHRGAVLRHLVLLAPAFGFARRRLEGERWEGYRHHRRLKVFHHAENRWMRLGPDLLEDLPAWREDEGWTVDCPVTLIHGIHDASVPVAESRAFAARPPDAGPHEVDDDHGLLAPETLTLLETVLAAATRE